MAEYHITNVGLIRYRTEIAKNNVLQRRHVKDERKRDARQKKLASSIAKKSVERKKTC